MGGTPFGQVWQIIRGGVSLRGCCRIIVNFCSCSPTLEFRFLNNIHLFDTSPQDSTDPEDYWDAEPEANKLKLGWGDEGFVFPGRREVA